MKVLVSVCLLLFVSSACVRTTSSGSQDTQSTQAVEKLEDAWMQDLVSKDTAALSKILAPEFTLSGSSEERETREQYLQTSAMPTRNLQPLKLEDRQFKAYGQTVVSTGKTEYAGTWKDNAFRLPVRYTNVYARLNGTWQVVSAHLSIRR
ncbi:nuclear transport factor 2 family protein [Sabulibacter ruber]|uniref:nuclear transport factor 2 family protein n=1 Tax=Sabulibacter ruber TaxID=2811901 RepID=UPI001A95AB36|nr:nuclear transport factor 2 family protein [Sabulibacter ruber]